MSRKNSKSSKSISTDKKFTTVPPKARPVEVSQAAAQAVAVETATVVMPQITAEITPAVVTDLSPLLAALHDLDADVAREAATALGNSGNPAAVEPLIEIVSNTNGYFHTVVRSAAAAGLATLKDLRAVDALIKAVSDPITDSSTEAIRALAALGDCRAVAPLAEVISDQSGFYAGSVRRTAVLGLAKLGGEAAIASLRAVAANENEDALIREEAIEAINAR